MPESSETNKSTPIEDALRAEIEALELLAHMNKCLIEDIGEQLAEAKAEIERLEDTQYQPMYRDGENPNE